MNEQAGVYQYAKYELSAEAFSDTDNWVESLSANEQNPALKNVDAWIHYKER